MGAGEAFIDRTGGRAEPPRAFHFDPLPIGPTPRPYKPVLKVLYVHFYICMLLCEGAVIVACLDTDYRNRTFTFLNIDL